MTQAYLATAAAVLAIALAVFSVASVLPYDFSLSFLPPRAVNLSPIAFHGKKAGLDF